MANVQQDTLLVSVHVVEETRVIECWVVADYGAPKANWVDRLLMLDLNHLCTEVGEKSGGRWTGDDPGQVHYTDTAEGEGLHELELYGGAQWLWGGTVGLCYR